MIEIGGERPNESHSEKNRSRSGLVALLALSQRSIISSSSSSLLVQLHWMVEPFYLFSCAVLSNLG